MTSGFEGRKLLRDEEILVGGRRARLTMWVTAELPTDGRVGAAHCLGFDREGRFLLTRHVDRGWTIPGGRREDGESIEDTLRRETIEEAAALIADPQLLAVERFELIDDGPDPDPPFTNPAYQAYFIAEVTEVGRLVPNEECTESALFDLPQARRLPGWLGENSSLLAAAVAEWTSRRATTAAENEL